MDVQRPCLLAFGDFELDVRARELRKHGLRIRLQDQSFQILLMLLEHPGDVVLREEIRQKLWPNNTVVEFNHSINAAIKRLRNALGESAEEPRHIETLAKRGYRFLGETEQIGGPQPEARGAAAPLAEMLPIPAVPQSGVKHRFRYVSIAGAIIAALFIFLESARFRDRPDEPPVVRFSMFPPEGAAFGGMPSPSVSPDGRRIVFVTVEKNSYRIWVRSLDVPAAVPIPGADGGAVPFWSPDSRFIAFFASDGKLKRVDASDPSLTGKPVTICNSPYYAGGAWGRDGTILFSNGEGTLYRVAATGGTPVPATKLDAEKHEHSHSYPWFLPDGRHFLYSAAGAPAGTERVIIKAGSLDSTETKILVESESNAIFSQGRLVYVRDGKLMAQPFDIRSLAATGNPVPLVEHLSVLGGLGNFSMSQVGTLVYYASAESPFELAWFDRNGKRLSTLGEPLRTFFQPNLSPDQRWIAVDHAESNNADIWLYDAGQGGRTRFTFDPAMDVAPVWSPDGKSIAFASSRGGHFDLYKQAVGGNEAAAGNRGAELLYADSDDKFPTSWSPAGDFLTFDRRNDKPPYQSIWALPLASGKRTPSKPFPVIHTPVEQRQGRFSPDGRWIAYESGQSGKLQIYIAPFRTEGATPGAEQQVSTTQSYSPRWRNDGKELFYYSYERRRLTAVAVSMKEGAARIGEERELFGPAHASIVGYDVSPDGRRFVLKVRSREAASQPITVVQNWTALVWTK